MSRADAIDFGRPRDLERVPSGGGAVTVDTRVLVSALIMLSTRFALSQTDTVKECDSTYRTAIDLQKKLKLRAAKTQWILCASESCPNLFRSECTKRFDELDRRLPTAVFLVVDEHGNDVSDVKVAMDGELLTEHLDGRALALDPGRHIFSLDAPSHPTIQKSLIVSEGVKERQVRVALESTKTPSRPWLTRLVGASAVAGILGAAIAAFVALRRAARKGSRPISQQAAWAVQASGARHPATTYDIFISHASEDKEAVARPLYLALTGAGLSVWFDEAELQLGDSLRRKIDDALSHCRYGVVILSPRFLEKEWPQRELDGLVARETLSGAKAILPIWFEIEASTLMTYSPALADKLAARIEDGIPTVVAKILSALGKYS